MKVCLSTLIVIFALAQSIHAGSGEEVISDEKTLTLEQVLNHAVKKSPEILKVRRDLLTRLAEATDVQTPESPEVQVDYLQPTGDIGEEESPSSVDFEFTMPLRISYFGVRQAYASALKDVARQENQAAVYAGLNNVTLAYYRLWALEQRMAYLENAEALSKDIIIRIQARKDEVPEQQALLFEAEAYRFGAEAGAARAQILEAHQEIIRMTGLPYSGIKTVRPMFVPVPLNESQLKQFARSRSGMRQLIQARTRAADRALDVARLDVIPEFSPRFLYEWSEAEEEKRWGVGVAVKIPFLNQNKAEIQKARAEVDLAHAEEKAFQTISLDRLIEMRVRTARAFQTRADSYWTKILPAYRKLYLVTLINCLLYTSPSPRD